MGNESILSTSTLWFSLSLLFWCLNCLSPKNLSLFFFLQLQEVEVTFFFSRKAGNLMQSHGPRNCNSGLEEKIKYCEIP